MGQRQRRKDPCVNGTSVAAVMAQITGEWGVRAKGIWFFTGVGRGQKARLLAYERSATYIEEDP